MKKEKNVGIELLRIISMLMVLLLHELGHGGLLNHTSVFSSNFHLVWFMESFSLVAVYCYALITGFLMVNSRFKLRRIIELWLQVLFYTWIILIVFVSTGHSINLIVGLQSVFPTIFKAYWYFNSYLVIYFLLPVINGGIKKISPRTYNLVLCLLLMVCSVIPSVTPTSIDAFAVNQGYSPLWLLIMYLIGAYVKLYSPFSKWRNSRLFAGYIALSLFTFISVEISTFIKHYLLHRPGVTQRFLSYNSIFVLLASVLLFVFMIHVKDVNHLVKKIALLVGPLAFSAYLIQADPVVFFNLSNRFIEFDHLNSIYLFGTLLASVIVTFTFATTVDWIRSKLFKIIGVDMFVEKVITALNNISKKVSLLNRHF